MNRLFLDDIRTPYDVFKTTIDPIYEYNKKWVTVKSFSEFTAYISENGLPEIVSFDHDLSVEHYRPENQSENIEYDKMEQETGYHAALWLINYCKSNNLSFPDWKVHSQNIEGSKNIANLIKKEIG